MATIGNVIGRTRYVDIPVAAGVTSYSWTTDRAGLDLIGVQVYANGVTAAATSVGGSAVAGAAISSFTNGYGAVQSAAPTAPIPVSTHSGTTDGYGQQANSTGVGNVNFASSGAIQGVTSTLVDRQSQYNGSPAAFTAPDVTPLSANISSATAVAVSLTGSPTLAAKWSETATVTLNGAQVPGFIFPAPGSSSQSGWTYLPSDSIPFQVAASDVEADTVAGYVRLIFQEEEAAAPTGPTTAWPTPPTNGVNAPGAGTNAGTGTYIAGVIDVEGDTSVAGEAAGEDYSDSAPTKENTSDTGPSEDGSDA